MATLQAGVASTLAAALLLLLHHTPPARAIFGGSNAAPGYLPHQVGLWLTTDAGYNHLICGGMILDATHILTAGHCAYNIPENYMYPTMTVHTGVNILVPSVHTTGKAYVHPSFNPARCDADRTDVAVFEITPPFVFNSTVSPIHLPTAGSEDFQVAGQVATISG